MREIIIKNRKETDVTDETLYDLFNESFKRWTEKRLEAPWLNVSFEKFSKQMNTSSVFIAVDANTDELLGLHCFRKNKKHRWAYDFYLAVKPKAQGQGIASRMLAYEAEVIKQAGYRYLRGVTGTTAEWSVRWHLRNGYRIIGYYHSPNNNFANYVFRKQLIPISFSSPAAIAFILRHPVYALHSNAVFCRLRFWVAYAITRLTKDSNGQDNLLGRLGRKMIHQGH